MSSLLKGGGQRLLRVIQGLPLTLPAALAAFGVVAVLHLLIGQYRVSLVLPFGLAAAALAAYLAQKAANAHPDIVKTERRIFDVVVVLAVLPWCLFNLLFTSEHLFTNRDPATYNMAALWLGDHRSVEIPKPPALKQLQPAGVHVESLGFASSPFDDDLLHAQGAHLLPALGGLADKVAGIEGVLRFNVLLGGVALLAFYGFARLVVRPRWASLATLTMALSLPLIFLVRDAYTEPLTMAFIFGGLSLLWMAQRGLPNWCWALAGLVLGASTLLRIDAYLVVAGVALAVLLGLMVVAKRARRAHLVSAAFFGAGLLLTGYLAWLDVFVLSNAYYQAHSHVIIPELQLLAAVVVAGSLAVLVQWRWPYVKRLDVLNRRWRDIVIWVLTISFLLVMASRPLWHIGYQASGARSFSEQTINWLWWYYGPVLIAAGFAGVALLTTRILRGKDTLQLPFLLGLLSTALLYLVSPNITGDHPWATRRLLPIVMPGLVLLGMWFFAWLYARGSWRLRGYRFDLKTIATILVTLSVVSPLFITYPFAIRRLNVPELSQLQTVCQQLPDKAVVVWLGESADFAIQPTRTVCGNEAVGLALPGDAAALATNREQLARLAATAKEQGITLVVGWYDVILPSLPRTSAAAETLVSSIDYNEIEHTYKRAPRNAITINRSIHLGTVTDDGQVQPL